VTPPPATPAPTSDVDLFSDDVLADPYPAYAALRALGPAVFLPAQGVWALTRHREIREALTDHETYSSSDGVALNDFNNDSSKGSVLATDPPDHTALRRVLSRQLAPRAIASLAESMTAAAEVAVAEIAAKGSFDAVTDLVTPYVTTMVADLIGLPPEQRDRLGDWANAAFDTFGPPNPRTFASAPVVGELFGYLMGVATPDRLTPGSWGADIYAAAERGEIPAEAAVSLMLAYTTASMDTTISGLTRTIDLLARHPEQWAALRADPDALIPAAFDEALRLDAPVQVFARRVRRDVRVGEAELPTGAWVILLYGSAGRDTARWGPDAHLFDITRADTTDHLAFGAGAHTCAGLGLAGLEAKALLGALARHAVTLSPAGEPVRRLNNTLRGLAELPVTVA